MSIFAPPQAAWISYVPTFTALTVGNGTLVAAYAQIGKTVFVRIRFVMGSTSSVGTDPVFTLPVTAASEYSNRNIAGTLYIEDAGVQSYTGFLRIDSSTTVRLCTAGAAGTYTTAVNFAATIPFSWATSDFFSGTLVYEAA